MHAKRQLMNVLNDLLPVYQAAHKTWAEKQEGSADEFNLLEVMEVETDEACHSKILAWLLDRRIDRGTHAQGSLGFRLLLEELGTMPIAESQHQIKATYADEPNYWVGREVSGSKARIDVEIAARRKFVIHIENKILAAEGQGETHREWSDLQERARELGVPEADCHAIYLTLDGSKAKDEHFRTVGWNRIARVLERFAELAMPPEVQLFARHYAKAVRKLAPAEPQEKEVENAEVQ
ncbi:MAG: PD-(D/E)XK nuclease family protein [Thermoguttaceae bacterium]